MIARPVETIRFADDDYDSAFEQVKKYIKEFQVKTVVLGLPKHMNGDIGNVEKFRLCSKKNWKH